MSDPVNEADSLRRREWARAQKEEEIAELKRYLNPQRIFAEAERRTIWAALCRARTAPALKQVCEQWANLPDVRRWGLVCFPQHVLVNAPEFLRMKHKKSRFPTSDSATFDESRLEYLARGMAGVMTGVSPMTGIQLLRTMKHTEGGPLWKKEPGGRGYCNCWRCGLKRSRPAHRWSAEAWWNGIELFMAIAKERKKR